MQLPLKEASAVGYFAKHLDTWRLGQWLFVPANAEIELDTPCYQQDWDHRDLSPEEQNQIDDVIRSSGLRPFFEWQQINMVVENLRMQKQDYSDSDLIRAIRHYWEHDAYIVL